MTKKDYIALAAALRDAALINCVDSIYLAGVNAGVSSAANRIADALSRDNPRFDRERFLKAAGVK